MEKNMYDIVFLHPPSSFEKLKYPLSGVFAALVGSTDILAHEPLGMISMARDLLGKGYKTKVFNVGKMLLALRDQETTDIISIRDFIKGLHARIYAIGLHWAAHSPGAVELAQLTKEHHPESLVLLGGLTATYYHKEILTKFPFIDLVVLGEVDGIIDEIVDKALRGDERQGIPNIAYLENGQVVATQRRPPVKKNLSYVRGRDNELVEPNTDFSKDNPDVVRDCMIPVLHGCPRNCPFCGGSRYFYKKYFCRDKPEVTDAEEVAENIRQSVRQGAPGISLFGDLRFGGDAYWRRLTSLLAREQLHFDLYLEIFSPAAPEYMEAWRKTTSGQIVLALSPESADRKVREVLGRDFSNDDIIEQVDLAGDLGMRLSLGFMFALPEQDFASVVRTQAFINDLCHRSDRLISYMFEPFLFIDPGSLIFDDPEKYGYHIKDRTLEGLIKALSRPHWYGSLNYSTKWMSKKEIIEAMFFVGAARNDLYMDYLGPSQDNLFYKRLLAQQKSLVRILEENPAMRDEEMEDLIEKTVEDAYRQVNFSITGPDFDLVQQGRSEYTIDRVFRNTVQMLSKCYEETDGDKDLLLVLEEGRIFDEQIPVERYEEDLAVLTEEATAMPGIFLKPPRKVWEIFRHLVATLEMSLEGGLVDEFVKYDWALFLVNFYGEIFLKGLSEKGLPKDIRDSEILLPPKDAYIKLSYKHDGKVIRKPHWLTLEKGPTYLLVSYTGDAYPVTKREFVFLKGCGPRLSFPKFYKKISSFVKEPESFVDWLLTCGLILFAPSES
jgi:B12-binding domain/radical SAM domain protein